MNMSRNMRHVTRMNMYVTHMNMYVKHMNMRHVTHMNDTHMNESCPVWMSHGMRMKQSCRPYEWVMSHIREPTTSHFTYELVIWHSCARHIMHRDESCHTCEQVMSRI